jgi:ribosomal protein L29
MKMTEIRKLNEKELAKQLAALREQARDLGFKIHSKEIKNHHQLRNVKLDIARILTVLNAK